ncbi:hypothetical protein AIOL_001685 [Candidatus Rhodobacter oscarellae]|uniref:Uncharacterized protein n=1 Tax=Candidatus Rhodobacter oscarellae TaxID=1675527 RepID=A0A0J9E1Y0_9RHOB|nr:hypothetical protein AIOL_001685 [Candidatus Rhodobacter lobularis]
MGHYGAFLLGSALPSFPGPGLQRCRVVAACGGTDCRGLEVWGLGGGEYLASRS